jgi:UDP-glucose 4-epimerase
VDSTILVIGGLNGFIGSNTAEALVQLGHECVVTRHKDTEIPGFLQNYIDQYRILVEQADATSLSDLRRIGEKHKIDAIVNVGGGFRTEGPVPMLQGYLEMLTNIFRVAKEWNVKRVLFSSTAGVYFGLQQKSVNEDVLLPLESPFNLIAYQKIVEIAGSEFAKATGISTVMVRLMGMFGPWQDPAQSNPILRLAHAAVNGKPVNLEDAFFMQMDDEVAHLYIKDMARAIALLATAEKLNHHVYNIGGDKNVPNREILDVIHKLVPGSSQLSLPPGRTPFSLPFMENKRLKEDTGFTPEFDVHSAIQDYVNWLKAGNPR